MDEKIYAFSLFGVFRVYTQDKEVLLRDKLGKQLSSLFAFLLLNHNHPVLKDKLIDTFWNDSDNPANALKYAIFRLRGALKDIEEFKDIDLIVSANNAYQINPDLDINLDVEAFESAVSYGRQNNDIESLRNAFDIYCGNYLDGVNQEWIDSDRGYYQTIMLDICNELALWEINSGSGKKAIEYAEKGLSYDCFDEKLIYAYLKALVLDKKYSQAMTYYKNISKRYFEQMGFKLESTNKGFSEILSNNGETYISSKSVDVDTITGPMVVNSDTFNSICVYSIRNNGRYDTTAYVLTISLDKDDEHLDSIMNKFMSIFEVLFRKSDVICRINDNEFAILFRFKNKENTKIIENRINSRLAKIYTKNIKYTWKTL